MSWKNSHNTPPRIKNYAEAEAFFNGACVVRSSIWAANERPLSRRVDHNKRIERRELRATGTCVYDLTLYNTPLVTYLPNGEILVMRHDTKLSRSFLNDVLPIGLSTISHGDTTMIRANTPDGPAWYLGGKGALEFEHCGHNWWRLNSTPQVRVRQHMCLKRAAQIRKAAKPFLTWVMTTRALCGDIEPRLWLTYPERYPKTLEQLQDTEIWPDLAPYVADRAEWMQGAYNAFSARTDHLISDYEPPKRGRSHEYS